MMENKPLENKSYNINESLAEMSHDPIGQTARAVQEALKKNELAENGLITIEIFQGWLRSDGNMPDQKLIVTCPDLQTAGEVKKSLLVKYGSNSKVEVVVGHAHTLPFGENVASDIVDAHLGSHVGWDANGKKDGELAREVSPTLGAAHYGSAAKRLDQLTQEILKLAKIPIISRPNYFTPENHDQMKRVLVETLRRKAKTLGENGVLVASFATTRMGIHPTEEYYAVHHMEGEIVLTLDEIKEVMNQAGLVFVESNPGMAPKNQAVATWSAAKAWFITVAGGDDFKALMVNKIIPVAHQAMDILDKVLPKKSPNDKEISSFKPKVAGIGSRIGGEFAQPDRLVIVAKKTPQ